MANTVLRRSLYEMSPYVLKPELIYLSWGSATYSALTRVGQRLKQTDPGDVRY